MTQSQHATEQEALQKLAEEFPGWRIWRARKDDGSAGSWMATLHNPASGRYETLMRDSAEELREELVSQRAAGVLG